MVLLPVRNVTCVLSRAKWVACGVPRAKWVITCGAPVSLFKSELPTRVADPKVLISFRDALRALSFRKLEFINLFEHISKIMFSAKSSFMTRVWTGGMRGAIEST